MAGVNTLSFTSVNDGNSRVAVPYWTGLSPRNVAHVRETGSGSRPLSTAWMTEAWIAHTRRVWSTYLGHPVSEADAVEMLTNVRRWALALEAAEEHGVKST